MSADDLGLRYWTSRRVSRRTALRGAAVGSAALGAWALTGCSSGGNGNGAGVGDGSVVQDGYQDGTPTAEQRGGILRVRQNPAMPSMNVFAPGIFALAQQLFLGFTAFDHLWYVPTDTGVRELFLATAIEQPDELTVIATIGDATFHDKAPIGGRAVTAEDVAASYKRFREEAPFGYSWLHNVLDDVVATGEKTVTFTQKFPWAWFFTASNSGNPTNSSIMPQEILHGHDDFLRTDAIGSGHWMLDSHENGANIKLRRFPNFRTFQNGRDITGQPYLEGIDFKFIADDNVALAAFKAGDLDVGGFSSEKQAQDTVAEMGDRIVVGSDLSRDYICLMLTHKEGYPYRDIRVRQAINKLIDRDEAILLLEDGNAVKCGPVPPAHKRYALPEDDPVAKEYFTPDPADARKLLEAAAWDFDHEIVIKHSNRPVDADIAQVLKEQLARGGVKVKLEQQDLIKWLTQSLNQGDFEATCFNHLAYEDPDLPLRFYMADPQSGITNFMRYDDPKVTAACLAAAQELDEEARVEKVHEAQRVIMREAAPMFNILSDIGYSGRYAHVKGAVVGRGSYGLFNRTTWLDKQG